MTDHPAIFHRLQRQLFPTLEAELGQLSALDRQFCEVISLTDLGRFTQAYEGCGNGCPPCPRVWLAHAFVAKMKIMNQSPRRHFQSPPQPPAGFSNRSGCGTLGA